MADATETIDAPAAPETPASPTTTPAVTPSAWYESLPEGLKTEKTLQQFKDPAALAQSYMELKRWQSGAIKKPGVDAKPEDIARYRESLGVPKTPEGYDLEPLKGLNLDPQRAPQFLQYAHSIGLNNEQVTKTLQWAFEREQHLLAEKNEGYMKEHDTLADQWGKTVYDRRAQLAQRTIDRFASPEDRKWLEDTKETNNPRWFRIFSAIGEQFAEDGIIDGRVEGIPTPEQAQQRITELRAEMAKTADGTPRMAQLQASLEEQYKIRYPSGR